MLWHRMNQIGDLKAFAERCEREYGVKNMKRFAVVRTEEHITGKQHIVLSAHLNFSVGLGICIAHWL